MGGLSGHMMHPFDNTMLGKNDLKNMIANSLNGSIPMTEKIDGFNIHAYKVNGKVRFARNLKDLQKGGMSIDDIIEKWKDKPYTLNIYLRAAILITKWLNQIDWDNDEYFNRISLPTLNCECVVGETNIMPYPDVRVYIHNMWVWYEDTDPVIFPISDHLKNFKTDGVYFDQKIQIRDFHNTETIIEGYCLNVDNIFGEAETIEELYQMNFIHWLQGHCEWVLDSKEGTKVLYNRFFHNNKTTNLKIIKSYYPEYEELIDKLCKEEYKYCLDYCKGELKDFIYNVGNTILEHATGYVNEDNKYMVCQNLYDRLKETDATLWNYDYKINPLEGVVFEFDGQTYKWTGSFAIINKILGQIKYEKTL